MLTQAFFSQSPRSKIARQPLISTRSRPFLRPRLLSWGVGSLVVLTVAPAFGMTRSSNVTENPTSNQVLAQRVVDRLPPPPMIPE
ncbi:MAG: hypothetical protein AB4042_00765 [Leptolyngbyaceae cyanobacterium]